MTTYTLAGSFDLERGWAFGSHTWKPGMDLNLRKLANLTQGTALSRTTPLPLNAAAETVYIVPPGEPHAGMIAMSDGPDAWSIVSPHNGVMMYVEDAAQVVCYIGGIWYRVASPGTVPPNDYLTIAAFAGGLLPDLVAIFRRVMAGQVRILASGPHYARCEVAPTASITISIRRDLVSIGSIAFGAGNTVGTVTIGADVVCARGQVLDFKMDTVANGMANAAFTIGGRREYNVT